MGLLSSPTLQDLLTEVRILLNQRDPDNSFWSEKELTNYLNEAVRIHFLEAVQANEGYYTTQTGVVGNPDLDIVSGAEKVALPSDCFEIKVVYKKVTTGWVALPYRNNMTEGYSDNGGTSSEAYLPYYTFQGNSIVLRPTPNFNETGGIRLEYLQFPTTLIYGGDSLTNQVSPVFKQLIIMYAVYKAKLKESMVNNVNVHAVAESNLGALYKSFKDSIAKRSKYPTYVIPYNPESGNV